MNRYQRQRATAAKNEAAFAKNFPQQAKAEKEMAQEFFRVSVNYIYWAHQPGADDAQPLACELMDLITAKHDYILVPYAKRYLIAEIASVAELYVGGRDTDIRAARVLKRARAVLAAIDARAAQHVLQWMRQP